MKYLLIALAITTSAHAVEIPSCRTIRHAVDTYGEEAVLSWARAKGITEQQIRKLKNECLRQ